jgi:hypothetical protein
MTTVLERTQDTRCSQLWEIDKKGRELVHDATVMPRVGDDQEKVVEWIICAFWRQSTSVRQ